MEVPVPKGKTVRNKLNKNVLLKTLQVLQKWLLPNTKHVLSTFDSCVLLYVFTIHAL